MEPIAIVMMLLYLIVIWGGLGLSIVNYVRTKDETSE